MFVLLAPGSCLPLYQSGASAVDLGSPPIPSPLQSTVVFLVGTVGSSVLCMSIPYCVCGVCVCVVCVVSVCVCVVCVCVCVVCVCV